ncbi:MAG: DUF4129 domain-containing protein [Anaerolineales bacterium]|nr:DUF4129 domain-containing protein [Anaerolineales bacterium]
MKSQRARTPVDILSVAFYIIVILLAAFTTKSANWTDHLNLLVTVGILGALSGVALAYSYFGSRTSILFAIIYGIFVIGWRIGATLDPALPWREKIFSLVGRLGVFFETVFRGSANQDPLMFVFLMAILFWFMAAFGAWVLFRSKGFWGAVLIPGFVILINLIFFVGEITLEPYLAMFLFVILLLATRLDLWRRQEYWKRIRAHLPANIFLYVTRSGVLIAILIILIAWAGPVFAESEEVSDIWFRVSLPFLDIRDRLGDAFGGLRSPVAVAYDFFGDTLTLGAGVDPADVLVMEVIPESLPEYGGRFYWFSRAYNYYENGSWQLTIGETAEFDPNAGDLAVPQYLSREVIETTFAPKLPSFHGVYIASQPLWMNRSGEVEFYRIEDGAVDPLRVAVEGVIRHGETYNTRAQVSAPRAKELREASVEYPEWIMEHYLQVPESITERTRELARRITADLDNPYDKASAITAWLRRNIRYQRETEPPPPDVEVLDWFIFDYQVGFCNWYASAEIIMLRAVGVPARLAVGYARGEYDRTLGTYSVYGEDAHAWPEVYFPEYGWIEFEPTGNQPVLRRPEEPAELDRDRLSRRYPLVEEGLFEDLTEDLLQDLESIDVPEQPVEFNGNLVLYSIVILLVVVVGSVALWMYLDPISRTMTLGRIAYGLQRVGVKPSPRLIPFDYQNLTPTGKVYARWNIWLKRLNLSLAPAQTPHERAELFESAYPSAASAGWTIVEAYEDERFGGIQGDEVKVRTVWQQLRPYLWFEWFRRKVNFLRRKNQA